MKKITFLSVCTLLLQFTSFAQNGNGTIDAPGDIAIIGIDTADDDGLAFVLLDDAPNGTSIRFTDDEWDGISAFSSTTSEGEVLWENNTGNPIAAGTVITINNADGDGIVANQGTATEPETGFVISTATSAEQVYAFLGTRAVLGTFLAFTGSTVNASIANTGLVDGETALVTTNFQGRYTGTNEFNGSLVQVAMSVNDISNWTQSSYTFPDNIIGDFTGTAFGTTLSNELLQEAKTSIYTNNNSFVSTDASLTIEVYNTLGQKVNNSGLASGIYILKVTNAQGEIVTVKKAI